MNSTVWHDLFFFLLLRLKQKIRSNGSLGLYEIVWNIMRVRSHRGNTEWLWYIKSSFYISSQN